LHGGVLQVRRIAVLLENFLHQDAHPRPRGFTVHPVHGDGVLDACHEFMSDDAQLGFSHKLFRAAVLGERVVKGDFFIAQAGFLAALPRLAVERRSTGLEEPERVSLQCTGWTEPAGIYR
jgi:hypothetical protein